jgi:tetratricopeptide (TPR) repeat protein
VLTAALSIQRKLLGADHPDSLSSLQSLGWAFEGEGKWAEAEAAHRESLVRSRGRAGMEDPQTLEAMNGLVRVLLAEGKVVESEQLLKEVLTPSYSRQPSAVRLLALRVELMGRQGRWPEALESAKLTVELQPAEHYRYHTLAALLAVTRDQTGYEALCRRMLTNFSDTLNPYVAERIAQACLHLPQAGVDLATVAKMADRSVLRGSSEPGLPFFQLAKAMAGYRQGRYPEAIEWAEKSLTGKVPEAHAKAYAVLAMARWRSGDLEGARNFLAKGEALAPSFASDRGPVNVGESWLSWLSARISLDEAKGLVQSVQNLTKP